MEEEGSSPRISTVYDHPDCRTAVCHRRAFGVWLRGSIYHFRVRVPHDLRSAFGRTHLSRSLRTDSLTVANRLAARCALEAAASFDRARQTSTPALLGEVAPTARTQVTFGELCNRYLDDPTADRTNKSTHA
ncbi:DUF6538 domain-containing protein [Novosphingobium sp. CCH12-A3]|uniref:DUF6538 domain-containing protein n=1 Tax=Novosphingobium sp. CCH12-A3 TaxID=1768752 RepID=UPI0035111C36